MPEKSTLRAEGIGLASPARDILVGTMEVNGADVAPNGLETFVRTVTIACLTAGTAVSVIADDEVGTGRKVYVTDFYGLCQTANFAGLTDVRLQDTSAVYASAVTFVTLSPGAAGLNTSSKIYRQTGNETVVGTPFTLNSGTTAGKGLRLVGNQNGTGSGTLTLTVIGYIA